MRRTTILGALALATTLGACSSGNGPKESSGRSFERMMESADALQDDWRGTPAVAAGALPYAGSASYEGVLYGEVNQGNRHMADIAGDLSLGVDFSTNANPLTGRISHVRDNGELGLRGDLDIAGSFINRSAGTGRDRTFGATFSGTLLSETLGDVVVAGTMNGDFHGDGLGMIEGGSEATLSHNGGFYTMDGTFIAERTD
ncbi:hypothetical protein [Pseudoroseicyclus sp. CXY001]|uniref:hypothetical protein n=1 Tax=Pseudoroseicyclus sp. CXY001 TaxID=3242492 RepID=UPI00358DC7EE